MGSGHRHRREPRRDCSARTYPGLSTRLFSLAWLSGRMLALGDRVSLRQLPLSHPLTLALPWSL